MRTFVNWERLWAIGDYFVNAGYPSEGDEVREIANDLESQETIWNQAIEAAAFQVEGESCAGGCDCRSCAMLNAMADDIRKLKRVAE